MASIQIPDDLLGLLAERRVIPFIGAGFSSVHGVPSWENLLNDLVDEIQAGSEVDPVLSYQEISKACNGDNLQIAEYLYLIAGESIGPLRHGMSGALRSEKAHLESTPHVELANLGAPFVYTTNFDDLIEKTFRTLGLEVDVIALPRDMALSHADRIEIVKYHGDLRYDQTLVLTESQYYTRLEFESPMDLKFRSDLLGRSVLFMGYSFRDINIRVIWFRLMQMMQDVPIKDRPASYIVRLRPNPVLDTLYEAVGLRTLLIDPDGKADTADEKNRLLAEFMMELSLRGSSKGRIPGTSQRQFVSLGRIEEADSALSDAAERQQVGGRIRLASGRLIRRPSADAGSVTATVALVGAIERLLVRQLTEAVRGKASQFIQRLAELVDPASLSGPASAGPIPAQLSQWYLEGARATAGISLFVIRALLNGLSRVDIVESGVPSERWEEIWGANLPVGDLRNVLNTIESEVEGHEDKRFRGDFDLAFAVDIAKRIEQGNLLEADDASEAEIKEAAEELLSRAAAMYDSVNDYEPGSSGPPTPDAIIRQIEEAARTEEEEEDEAESGDSSDPPF